jgi:hypothetical protein
MIQATNLKLTKLYLPLTVSFTLQLFTISLANNGDHEMF